MKILCKILPHKYYVYAKPKESWGDGIRWLKCHRCGKDFAMNDRVKCLLPMDFELMDMHEWTRLTPYRKDHEGEEG
jgi:hypothetical protein